MENIQFVGAVAKPVIDPVTTAIELIQEQQGKVKYDAKEKWLVFTGPDIDFLKAVRSKLAANLRRQYGNSRQLQASVIVNDDGNYMLYIHSDRY